MKPRVSRTKGHLSKRTAFVRDIVKEVAGYILSIPILQICDGIAWLIE